MPVWVKIFIGLLIYFVCLGFMLMFMHGAAIRHKAFNKAHGLPYY